MIRYWDVFSFLAIEARDIISETTKTDKISDEDSITRTIRHCNVWRSRTSKEIVIPTMGSDLRGRSDGASRRSHPRTLVVQNSFLRVVYKGTTMPRR